LLLLNCLHIFALFQIELSLFRSFCVRGFILSRTPVFFWPGARFFAYNFVNLNDVILNEATRTLLNGVHATIRGSKARDRL